MEFKEEGKTNKTKQMQYCIRFAHDLLCIMFSKKNKKIKWLIARESCHLPGIQLLS